MKPAVWTESSMRRVLPSSEPPPDAGAAIRLDLARGESGSAQVLLRAAGGAVRDVRLETEGLMRADGRARLEPDSIEWHQVGFVRVGETKHPYKRARTLPPGWYPDPLLPVSAFDLQPDFTQPVWVTVSVPRDAPPGEYAGALRIRAPGCESMSVPLRVRVHAAVLAPGAGRFRTSFDLLGGFLEQHYGKPVPRPVYRRYGEYLLRHRLNPDDFSRNDPPDLDDLRHFAGLGLNSFCVINLAKHRGESIRGGLNSPPEWYTEASWSELERRVDPLIRALKADRALRDKAYVHGFDERDIDTHGDAMRLFFGRVKDRWGLPTLTTSHVPTDPAVLRDLRVDWLCPIFAQYVYSYDYDKAERARAAGFKIWSYISLEPYAPFPNWRLDSPLMEARTIGWQAFHQKMDGFLYWGLNVWHGAHNDRIVDPARGGGPLLDFSITCPDASHDWLHGDGVLLYPGADGPIGSMRLANIRDGLQDYELLAMLRDRSGDAESARAAAQPVTEGLDRFTADPTTLEGARRRVLEALRPA